MSELKFFKARQHSELSQVRLPQLPETETQILPVAAKLPPRPWRAKNSLTVSIVEIPFEAHHGADHKKESAACVEIGCTGQKLAFPLGNLGENPQVSVAVTRKDTFLGRGVGRKKDVVEVSREREGLLERLLRVSVYFEENYSKEEDAQPNPAFAKIDILRGAPVSHTVALRAKSTRLEGDYS